MQKPNHDLPIKVKSTYLKLQSKKVAIDKDIKTDSGSLIVLVKETQKKELTKVENDQWPDSVECTYNVYKNHAGEIIFIAKIPFSESGDWDIVYKHYFDQEGHTFAFTKEESYFDDNVKGGIVRKKLVDFYDGAFKTIHHSTRMVDKDYHLLSGNMDNFDVQEFPYHIYKNRADCLKGYGIKL